MRSASASARSPRAWCSGARRTTSRCWSSPPATGASTSARSRRWSAPIGRADAEFVKARTGFTIGGVSPVGHATKPVMLVDRELFRFDEIWAAAGHPNGVFRLSPKELAQLTGAPVEDVVQPA